MHWHLRTATLTLAALPLAACRNATSSSATPGAPELGPGAVGANGCFGPNQVFSAPQTPVQVPLASLVLGPYSQMTAASGAELLYVTGANATVYAVDLTTGTPVETEILGAGAVAFTLNVQAGITTAPELSGIAVLDSTKLVLVEHASNALLFCDSNGHNALGFYAGQPNETPGFADGFASGSTGVARFSFTQPTQIVVTAEAEPGVVVADVGNHAVRLVTASSGPLLVTTLAGAGSSGFADGDITFAAFDTPSGLTLACDQQVIVSERGENGQGQRLRSLVITSTNPFGGWFGTATTVAGDGTAGSTAGPALTAELSSPEAPLLTAQGELYWIDSGTGILRRKKANGNCDCPLEGDCATAVTTPTFTAGHAYSLTQTSSGVLYVLDGTDGVLWRVTP